METDLKKIVGHRLQMLRMEKNLTQEQMGEKLPIVRLNMVKLTSR